MAERHPEEGRKGGAMEGSMAHPYYYEPTVTAVTDMVVPATRVQWGPVIAGVIVSLAITFFFISLGVGIGFSGTGLAYWSGAFGVLGIFLGALLAARTAKAFLVPALVHGFMVWSIILILNTIGLGSAGLSMLSRGAGAGASPGVHMSTFGWSFFIGAVVYLIAALVGALVGMVHETQEEVRTTT